tara:strand:- start:83 stop:838 length:756 start_codon:yes stop_codon:yes gene_type:complete
MSKNLFHLIKTDLVAAKDKDPAARNYFEVSLTYSGFHAILFYRICHILWRFKLKFVSRFLSNLARILTSVEIHPAAKIGESFFIDHGSGLVIGETCIIGKNVTLYQHTTLGGISPAVNSKSQINVKRHPTIGDNVIIGSGAQILGPVNIGKNARIGANAVVLSNVPENMTYVGIPARKLESTNKQNNFDPYGIGDGKIDDPNKKSIHALFNEIHQLSEKINELQSKITNKKAIDVKNVLIKKKNLKLKDDV